MPRVPTWALKLRKDDVRAVHAATAHVTSPRPSWSQDELARGEAALEKAGELDCAFCTSDLEEFHRVSSEALSLGYEVQAAILASAQVGATSEETPLTREGMVYCDGITEAARASLAMISSTSLPFL